MNILVAERVGQSWQRVAVIACGKQSGSYNMPKAIQGQLAAVAAKAAINQFRAEASATEVMFAHGSIEYRVTRYS